MSETDLKNLSETNWDHLKTMSDDEIDTSDIPVLNEKFFSDAKIRMPQGKVSVLLNVDEDVVEWYEDNNIDIRNVANLALKNYVESHR